MVREWVLVLYGTMSPPQRNDTAATMTTVKKRVDIKVKQKTKNQNPDVFIKQRKSGKDKKFNSSKSTTVYPQPHSTLVDAQEESVNLQKLKKVNTNSYQFATTVRPRDIVKLPTLKSHNDNLNNLYNKKKTKDGLKSQADNMFVEKHVTSSTFPTESTVIPKKFGKYEKIEQFYPELRPVNEHNNPAFFTVTTKSKTDNDNLKSTSMMPTNSHVMNGAENESFTMQRARQQQTKTPKGIEQEQNFDAVYNMIY